MTLTQINNKLPKYERITQGKNTLDLTLHIKKWGIPIIVFKTMRKGNLPWYGWILFPKICLVMWNKE